MIWSIYSMHTNHSRTPRDGERNRVSICKISICILKAKPNCANGKYHVLVVHFTGRISMRRIHIRYQECIFNRPFLTNIKATTIFIEPVTRIREHLKIRYWRRESERNELLRNGPERVGR